MIFCLNICYKRTRPKRSAAITKQSHNLRMSQLIVLNDSSHRAREFELRTKHFPACYNCAVMAALRFGLYP
ncbi:unnamed protein product [Meloidogyne enterolobii]|uniref:Uncharacterized protein n=1 Tax=Meloidogyne enterolobii TaxID=390850 RepID=A0ACB1B6R8_MELEN